MTLDRVDKLVGVCCVATGLAVLGMLADWWPLVYYPVPVLATVFLLMGSLNRRGEWSRPALLQVSAFGAVLLGLFVVSHLALDSGTSLGGLPTATAVFVYLIWPFTTVVAPLLYVFVFHTWLRHDLADAPATRSTADR